MRGALLLMTTVCSACTTTQPAPVFTAPRSAKHQSFGDKPEDRIDEIVARMNDWKIDPVDSEPRMVLMPFDDYRLLVEQARDHRNWSRTLEARIQGAPEREPGLGR